MAEAKTQPPAAEKETKSTLPSASRDWPSLDRLHEEIDRIFGDFHRGAWPSLAPGKALDVEPFWRREFGWRGVPAVDIAETDDSYEITAELPGMDEKDIDVQLSNGMLVIKGEKKEEKEEKKKDYYVSERRFGSFHRSFRVPEGVDAEKIDAQFNKGVLMVSLPKSAQAKKEERKITVKAK